MRVYTFAILSVLFLLHAWWSLLIIIDNFSELYYWNFWNKMMLRDIKKTSALQRFIKKKKEVIYS